MAPPVDPRVQAEREQAAREAAASRRRQDEEIRQQREAANGRAMALLRSVLSEPQRRDLAAHGYFFVDAPSGRRYRIDAARAGNLKVIDRLTGVWTESLCVHQVEDVPVGDTMLIQKLLLETAEDALRATANVTYRDGRVVRSEGLLDRDRLERQLRVASAFPEAQA